MKISIFYSVYPTKEITEIFKKLFLGFINAVESEGVAPSIGVGNLSQWLNKNEATILQSNFLKIPFVRIEKCEIISTENLLPVTIEFNNFLQGFMPTINEIYKDTKVEVDYFSPELFSKVGNNNLNVKEDYQSAALFYNL